ncbi:glycosyltransferase [Swingsia samuiensis]|uniref:Glycosyltransferase n=1 Tax=Swingsia samuiensis TaxID=1293412 RepID=A0A4Y6UIG9_9PROT|nr:glycosyltransferase [Swingsia samuiensis]QDH16620.1 glycosyltransferase [Swingsia samuiensis]
MSHPISEVAKDRLPHWKRFDADWYLARYPEIGEWMREEGYDDLHAFYLNVGQRYGHSPNRYFDELWYRDFYDDVRRDLIQEKWRSGFEHYCEEGYKNHSAHWLFDENEYLRRYPELNSHSLAKEGFLNGYDHYLSKGESEGFVGHRFFDERVCAELSLRFPEYFNGHNGLFSAWLVLPQHIADAGRVSWYFDPVWYLERYPEVRKEIEEGNYSSALHHYLTNKTPRQFDPQAFFSEEHYATAHPDIAGSLDMGAFRNGYEHFVHFGAYEGRSPHADVPLKEYLELPAVQRDVRNKIYTSGFSHWVASHSHPEKKNDWMSAPRIDEYQSRRLFEAEAEALLPVIAHKPLDFSVSGVPELSVIVIVHNHIALTMQALASLRANYAGAMQLIIIDSGSHDQTTRLPELVKGAHIVRYPYNIGYLEGCNHALKDVRAPFVLYLNNDVRLYPDAILHALRRLRSEADIGAVGGKLIRTNMKLQEAGSVIWRNGMTYGYRREDDSTIPEVSFRRDVDYCSAAFLMVRAPLLRELGGYDERYRPAYFEDTDLCVRIEKAGMRIVYDPSVVVEHLEFGSSGSGGSHTLIQMNWRKFSRIHQEFLRHQQPQHISNAVRARERRSDKKHILFIEDRIPLRRLGSGYVRSNDIVREMVRLGYQVSVFPMLPREQSMFDLLSDFPDTVELLEGHDLSTFSEFIQERAGYYDVIWVGRTHNMARLLPILNAVSRYLPANGSILDTEVIATPRTLEKIKVLDLEKPDRTFDEMLREELESAYYSQQIVTVTESDASLVRHAGYENVSVLGHEMRVHPTAAPFEERKNILFLGALHDVDAPNYDSLKWFVDEVLPYLDNLLPPDVRFTIAGFVHPSVDISVFARHPRVDAVGAVKDLSQLFNQHRVFVAPTRFAGGLPFKVQEAAAYGLPMVVTTLLQKQVNWEDGRELLAVSAADPEGFASAVARVYQNGEVWQLLRNEALEAIKRDCSPERFRQDLSNILQNCIV